MKSHHDRGGADHEITMRHCIADLFQGGLILFMARQSLMKQPEPFNLCWRQDL